MSKMNTLKQNTDLMEQSFQNLEREGEDMNFLTREATKAGIDFDEDTKDEFNRELLVNE